MPQTIGVIENKTQNVAKTGKPYLTFTVAGLKCNCFDMSYDTFKVGESVQLEMERNGDYLNFVDMKYANIKRETSYIPTKQEFHLSPEQVRSNALMCAIKASGINPDDTVKLDQLILLSNAFVEYIEGKK